MNIYLVRHGQTQNNANGEYYGKLDVPLNEKGTRQMEELRAKISHVKFDLVHSSSLNRAIQSINICAPELKNLIQIDPRLCELNFGDFEGKTYEELCALYPEEVREWKKDWKNFCPPKGEAFTAFYARVSSFFEQMLTRDKENVLIMTHSGVIRAMYCYVLGGNTDLYWNFTCQHGKINIIKYEYGNLFIDAINKGEI